MNILSKPAIITVLSLFATASAFAEDRNGMSVTVAKKTAGRSSGKAFSGDESRRIYTFALTAKNNSIRNFPEGTVDWTILVVNNYGHPTKYSGTEKLPVLRPIQSAEVQFGTVPVWVYQSSEKEKLDYEVIISHGGKETIRVSNVSNFAALSAWARSNDGDGFFGPGERGERRRMNGEGKADEPKPREPEKEPAPKVAEVKPMPTPPIPPEPRKTAAETPPVPQPTFDFFNLAGKKPPTAN